MVNNNQGIFVDALNKFIFIAKNKLSKCSFLSEYLDKIVFVGICLTFIASAFVSSEVLGVVALFVTSVSVLNLFLLDQHKVFRCVLPISPKKLEMNLFEKFILVWFLVVVVSLFGSTLFPLSFKGFLKTVTYMGFYFSAVQYYRRHLNMIMPTIYLLCGCVLFQGVTGLIQSVNGVEAISTWQDTSSINPEDVLTRVYGTLKPYNPNLYGGYLVATIPCLLCALSHFVLNRKYNLAFVTAFGTLLVMFALVQSGCRGAYVALAFMLFCFCIYWGKLIYNTHNDFFKKIYFSVVAAGLGIVSAFAMLISSVRTRILSIFVLRNDSSTSFRFNVYQAVIQMIKDNWLLGIGVGNKNFREIYGLYMKTGFDALSTYNVFTELWVES